MAAGEILGTQPPDMVLHGDVFLPFAIVCNANLDVSGTLATTRTTYFTILLAHLVCFLRH